MKLKPAKVRTKCDNGACKNMADYIIYREDTMSLAQLRLCKSCLKEIAELSRAQKYPKDEQN